MKRINFCKGQSLFEVVFAIGVVALITVAVVSISTAAIRNNISAKNKSLADKYLNEMSEWLRKERDDNFRPFWAHASPEGKDYCAPELDDKGWEKSNICDFAESSNYIPGTIFMRGFNLKKDGNDKVIVVGYVTWQDSQGVHETRSTTVLTNWR